MKTFYEILTLLALVLFSFNVNAQVGQNGLTNDHNTEIPNTGGASFCDIYDVDIEITDVEWNVKVDGIGAEEYHAVHIEFIRPIGFNTENTTEPFTCDIMVNLFKVDDLPVKFIYDYNTIQSRVVGIYDGGDLVGFRVFPFNYGGGGIATTAGVMGRVNNVNNNGTRPCVQMIVTNRAGANCSFSNEMNVHCDDPGSRPRIAQIVEQDIKVYPSPAQNNLFVEVNDLDIREVNMMSLYGQTVSDKVSIRYDIDKMQINTTQLESGIYLIVLETASGTITKKVMIQKD